MRPASLLVVCALVACEADSARVESADAATDAKSFSCCALGGFSHCGCFVSGTNADGSCRQVPCDLRVVGGSRSTDERGCAYYEYSSDGTSCLAKPPEQVRGDDRAVGTPCAASADCDLSRRGYAACTRSVFGDAVGACFREECDPYAYDAKCDEGAGTCVDLGQTYCFPRCTLGDDGSAPTSCGDRAACHFAKRGTDGTGVGFCRGYCTDDSGCAAGFSCQTELGRCVEKLVTYTKKVGEACGGFNSCACLGGSPGFCTQYCRVGTDSCPTGLVCNPSLPVEFTTAPNGLAGYCALPCTADTQCAPFGMTCASVGGLSRKICAAGSK